MVPPPAVHASLKMAERFVPYASLRAATLILAFLPSASPMMRASTRPCTSSAATGSHTKVPASVLSLVSAGLVPPVKIRTLLGIVTAVATALVTEL